MRDAQAVTDGDVAGKREVGVSRVISGDIDPNTNATGRSRGGGGPVFHFDVAHGLPHPLLPLVWSIRPVAVSLQVEITRHHHHKAPSSIRVDRLEWMHRSCAIVVNGVSMGVGAARAYYTALSNRLMMRMGLRYGERSKRAQQP